MSGRRRRITESADWVGGDILNAFNHGNTVDAIRVYPSQLYTALESGLVMSGQDDTDRLVCEKPSGSFLQVSGITYTYDPAGEEGNKVVYPLCFSRLEGSGTERRASR